MRYSERIEHQRDVENGHQDKGTDITGFKMVFIIITSAFEKDPVLQI